jgi:AcrR family transcriptional regulator
MSRPDAGATRKNDVGTVELTERIERVAMELFIRNGYHGVSYLGIAKELGITHSNVHYYYRNKTSLAEAVLRRVAAETLASTGRIWRNDDTTLLQKFVLMRDWIHQSYLRFNPDGKGGRPWGLLSRFSMEADALTVEMKQIIRTTLKRLEADVRYAVEAALESKELVPDSPADGITLQILSVMHLTGQLTRHSSGFARLDALLMWTIKTLYRAYGSEAHEVEWPPCRAVPIRLEEELVT